MGVVGSEESEWDPRMMGAAHILRLASARMWRRGGWCSRSLLAVKDLISEKQSGEGLASTSVFATTATSNRECARS